MFGTRDFPAFLLVVVVLIVVPGPSVIFVASRALALGRKAALATVVGNACGLAVQVAMVALGIGAVVAASIAVFTAVKLVGAAYLVVLGIRVVRDRRRLAVVRDAAGSPRATRRIVREGFVVGMTNPKGLLIFSAVLPQFVSRSAGHVPLQLASSVRSAWRSRSVPIAPGRWRPRVLVTGSIGLPAGSNSSAAQAGSP
jgi:threonine/homoserine/homoserine lactone efflux protein